MTIGAVSLPLDTAELSFEDMEAFQSALGSPEGQAAAADVPKFASGGVTMMIAEA